MNEGERTPPTMAQSLLIAGTILIIAAAILAPTILRLSSDSIWDDSYMFYRYANNVLARGAVSFSMSEPPAYGLTSLAYLVIVLPVRILCSNPALIMAIASLIGGLLFFASLLLLVWRYGGGAGSLRIILTLFIAFSLAYATNTLATHLVNGMDTTFALAYLAIYIFLVKRHEERRSMRSALQMAVWGGAGFAVRPDMLIYTVGIPTALLVLARNRESRRQAAIGLGVAVALIAIQVGFTSIYFRSPLPLPFYAKTHDIYGEYFRSKYQAVPWARLKEYVASYPFLVAGMILPILVNPARWWKRMDDSDKGLLACTAVFVLFYLFFVVQVMSYSSRFYYPTLPGIAILSARGIAVLAGWVKDRFPDRVRADAPLGRALVLIALILMAGTSVVALRARAKEAKGLLTAESRFVYDMRVTYRNWGRAYWYCLEEFSKLPDDLVIATTEVGHPAAMNPRKTVIDLAGLNETSIAHEGFVMETVARKHLPDLIYLPHPDYRQMNAAIMASPFFREHYYFYTDRAIRSRMGLALRFDSKYYGTMRQIIDRRQLADRMAEGAWKPVGKRPDAE